MSLASLLYLTCDEDCPVLLLRKPDCAISLGLGAELSLIEECHGLSPARLLGTYDLRDDPVFLATARVLAWGEVR